MNSQVLHYKILRLLVAESSRWRKYSQSAMRRDAMTHFPRMTLSILLLMNVSSNAQKEELFVQADVYSELYEAYIQCDADFDQSRSEFITEKLEHGSGQITIASLRKILNYNVEIANQAIAQESLKRELYLSEISGAHSQTQVQSAVPAEDDETRHEKLLEIDAFLMEKSRYVDVHNCVLDAL